MMERRLLFLLLGVALCLPLSAQTSDFETIIARGISDYQSGKYENALSWFSQAYKMNRKSDLACYQLALTNLALHDNQNAAFYSAHVIDSENEYKEDAYLVNGSAWENLGRKEKARRIYKEALKKYPANYLMHYNLALSLFNDKIYDEALEHTVNAIELYPAHASSHLLLGYIMFDKGERVQSMLPLYYFLLIEPESERSQTAYDFLGALWNQGVRPKGQKDIQLVKAGYKYGEFAPAELALSVMEHGQSTEEKESKEFKGGNNILVNFASKSKRLFEILEEQSPDKKGFWWEFYVDFFSKIERNNLSEPFSYFISTSRYNSDVLLWMSDNHREFGRFAKWMEVQ